MTNKITDLENQPQLQQNTSSIIKDLDQLRILSMEEMSHISGGNSLFETLIGATLSTIVVAAAGSSIAGN